MLVIFIFLTASTGSNAATDGFYVGVNGTTAYILNRESTSLYLGTNGNIIQTISSNGNVGIGTTNPVYPLEVSGIIKTSTSFLGTTVIIQKVTALNTNGIQFTNNGGSEKMRITDGGNVGIGTNNPSAPLSLGNGGAESLEFNHNISSSSRILSYNRSNNTYRQLQLDALEHIFKTSSSEKMRITSNGNVGIGTTSPSDKLEVGGTSGNTNMIISDSSANSEVGIKLQNDVKTWTIQNWGSGGDNLRILNNAGNTIQLWDDNGNVGIGTTSPSQKLSVISSDNSGTTEIISAYSLSESQSTSLGYNSLIGSYSLSIITKDIQPITFQINSVEKMRIASDGNVGIGTNSPTEKLEVIGKAIIRRTGTATAHSDTDLLVTDATASSSTAQLEILGGNAGNSFLYFSDTDSYQQGGIQYQHSSDSMNFRVNASTAVSINSSRNVGIGTTSPNEKLSVLGNILAQDSGVLAGIDGDKDGFIFHDLYTSSGNYYGYKAFSGGNTRLSIVTDASERLTVLANGNVGIGTTAPSEKLEVDGNTKATSFIKDGGTSTQYLMADGSVTSGAGGGVTKIIAGTNVTISPVGGTGDVTINASGGSGSSNWTLTGNDIYNSNSGNIGIGTASPSEKLEVDGIIKVVHTDSSYAKYRGQGVFFNRSDSYLAPEVDNSSTLNVGYNGSKWGNVEINGSFIKFENGANETMRIDANGNLGIGTTSPSYKLHNIGTSRLEGRVTLGGNVNNFIQGTGSSLDFKSNGEYNFTKGANTLLRILSTGNVGIGTTSPSANLEITSTLNQQHLYVQGSYAEGIGALARIKTTANGNALLVESATVSDSREIFEIKNLNGTVLKVQGDGKLQISEYGSGTFTGTAVYTLGVDSSGNIIETTAGSGGGSQWTATGNNIYNNNSGNIGIGVTSPGAKLEVVGQDANFFSTTSNQRVKIGRFPTEMFDVYVDDSSIILTATQDSDSDGNHSYILDREFAGTGDNNFEIRKSNSTQLLIDKDGKVGIGTTTPSSKLQVAGGVQMADDTDTASADKVGTQRYKADSNNSYVDMCMQTGATTYEWVNIVQNNW